MPTIGGMTYTPQPKCLPLDNLHLCGKRASGRLWRQREAAKRRHARGLCGCKAGR